MEARERQKVAPNLQALSVRRARKQLSATTMFVASRLQALVKRPAVYYKDSDGDCLEFVDASSSDEDIAKQTGS
eukprot:7333789-Lingulodinium_polyedra.AAC.1